LDAWLEDNSASKKQWQETKEQLRQNGLDLTNSSFDETAEKVLDAKDSNEVVDILFKTLGTALN
jgi:hypothetical protein